MNITPQALTLLRERYFHDGETTPEQMFRRVSDYVARDDTDKRRAYYAVLSALDFLPNSPTLMNAGREGKSAQLSACFVVPVPDSIEGIFEAVKCMAIIHKSGGGTGFSFNRVRPMGATVQTTRGLASGPVSFMQNFETATQTVMQGGMRRGANMAILNIDHADILDFITCKDDCKSFQSFNLSVGMNDDFMRRAADRALALAEYETWSAIIDRAWRHGCPGLVFLDECNRHNPTPELGRIEATNPCGEVPMLPWEACNLGSLNLAHFTDGGRVDFDRLRDTVCVAVDFLNDVIDVNVYPLPQIAEMVRITRKIGLGVMGWADMLAKLGIVYGSPQSIQMAHDVMQTINDTAHRHSGGRNTALTCIAPTGSISMIAGCEAGGIEPFFALEYDREVFAREKNADGTSRKQLIHFTNADYEESRAALDGRIRRGVFRTAHEISPREHIDMQAAFQFHTDQAVSKTINLINSAVRADIEDAYIYAWKSGCKGITVFRDGCRSEQVLRATEHTHGGDGGKCPECGGEMIPSGGCEVCPKCGYSPCKV